MYKSGQFLEYVALREDWLEEDERYKNSLAKQIAPLSSLYVFNGVTHQLTATFEFLSRLAISGVYDEGLKVTVTLFNTKGRALRFESNRTTLLNSQVTESEAISFEKEYTKDEIVSKPKEYAAEVISQIFAAFGWDPTIEVISAEQNRFLTDRI